MMKNQHGHWVYVVILLGRERPPSKTTSARTKKSDIEKQRHSSRSYDVHNRPNASRCDHEKSMVGTKQYNNMTINLEILPTWKYMFSHVWYAFFVPALHKMPRSKNTRAYNAQNTKIRALVACLAQPTCPIPASCGTDMSGRRAFEPPPEDGARSK